MEIYAPLADRMGMNLIRDELEDLSFSILNSKARDLITERLKFIKNNREDSLKVISEELIDILKKMVLLQNLLEEKRHLFQFGERFKIKKFLLNI